MKVSTFALAGALYMSATLCMAQHPMLQPAWDAFNKAEDPRLPLKERLASYDLAIKLADKCIGDYAITSSAMETDLKAKGVPPPLTGDVPAEQKRDIASRGPLNDASACYFIRGRSSQSLAAEASKVPGAQRELNRQARVAYTAGCKLQYARVWDTKGWFWKPADEMCSRLELLPKQ